MFTREDLIYLAGFFDGEGSISIVRVGDRTKVRGFGYQVQILLTQNPPCPILDECLQYYGGKIYNCGHGCVTKSWRCPAASVVPLLEVLLPFLRLKQKAAKIALEYQRGLTAVCLVPCNGGRKLPDIEHARRDRLYRLMQTDIWSRKTGGTAHVSP